MIDCKGRRKKMKNEENLKKRKEESKLIMAIVERAWKSNMLYKEKIDMIMDISKVHENNPMKLQEWLEADDWNFTHDIVGIATFLDRETGKLMDCFLPRYSI